MADGQGFDDISGHDWTSTCLVSLRTSRSHLSLLPSSVFAISAERWTSNSAAVPAASLVVFERPGYRILALKQLRSPGERFPVTP